MSSIDRRRFMGWLAAGSGALAAGCSLPEREQRDLSASPTATPTAESATPTTPAAPSPAPRVPTTPDNRILVLLELDGGNDGLDMVVPYADPEYSRLRPDIGIDLANVLPIDDEIGLNPEMPRLAARGVTTVEGVGTHNPDLSHFESMRRWHRGLVDGQGLSDTGFFGRLCDQLDVGATATGLTLSFGSSPSMQASKATTIALPDPDQGWWLNDDNNEWGRSIRSGLTMMSGGDADSALLHTSRKGMARALDFADQLSALPDESDAYEGGDLANQLSFAARVIDADLGVRVFHANLGGFDTHSGHRGAHDFRMGVIDAAVDSFFNDLAARGLDDRVLLATYSEFGRRPEQNDNGTDHGTASTALIVGPGEAQRLGAQPSLSKLDDDGNLISTVGLDAFYATLAEGWLGIPASEVLEGNPELLATF